jgi:hypothetical protein
MGRSLLLHVLLFHGTNFLFFQNFCFLTGNATIISSSVFVDNKSPLTSHDAVMPPIYCNELGVEFTLMVSMPLAGGDFHHNTKAFVLSADSLRRFHMNEKKFVLFAHKLCLYPGAFLQSKMCLQVGCSCCFKKGSFLPSSSFAILGKTSVG